MLTVLVVVLLLVAARRRRRRAARRAAQADDEVDEGLCTSTRTVQVSPTPRWSPTLRRVADEASGRLLSTGVCADVEVLARPSAEAAAAMAEDPAGLTADGPPDLWVPDSSVWLGRAVADPPRRDVTLTALGSLVSARRSSSRPARRSSRRRAGPATGPTWAAVLASGRPVALPDAGHAAPRACSPSWPSATSAPTPSARREALGTAAAALRQGTVADTAAAFALVADGGEAAPAGPDHRAAGLRGRAAGR